jgi:hypothetical protein
MDWLRAFIGIAAVFGLAACSGGLSEDDDVFIASTFAHVRDGQTDVLIARLDPSLHTPNVATALTHVQTLIADAGSPCERSLISATTMNSVSTRSGAQRNVTARHHYDCPNHDLVVDVKLLAQDGAEPLVMHFWVHQVDPTAAAETGTFDFQGKGPRHYAFLTAAIASPILMLIAILGVIFTRAFKRKWLWAIVSLAGITNFSMVWTTGDIQTSLVSLNLIGFGITKADVLSPWIVSFTPPVGALIVLSVLWPRWMGLPADEGGQGSKSA